MLARQGDNTYAVGKTETIHKVTADVSGQMIQDTEEEMKAWPEPP